MVAASAFWYVSVSCVLLHTCAEPIIGLLRVERFHVLFILAGWTCSGQTVFKAGAV